MIESISEVIRKNPYIISDTHFGHLKIKEYCNRPENWEELVIDNWNRIVSPEDTVLVLGDFVLGNREKVEYYTTKLNGYKYIVKGNHDRCNDRAYIHAGIFPINKSGLLHKNIFFTHRPIDTELPRNVWNIHGHIHNLPPKDSYHINVCVEILDYTPVRLSEILSTFHVIIPKNFF